LAGHWCKAARCNAWAVARVKHALVEWLLAHSSVSVRRQESVQSQVRRASGLFALQNSFGLCVMLLTRSVEPRR